MMVLMWPPMVPLYPLWNRRASEGTRGIRAHLRERIITSRMVRRWATVEGVNHDPVAKSGWCVHGHQGPDTHLLQCFAPTPLTESMMVMFLQLTADFSWEIDFADVKAAFC